MIPKLVSYHFIPFGDPYVGKHWRKAMLKWHIYFSVVCDTVPALALDIFDVIIAYLLNMPR